jgi:protein-disulfide isomerase
MSKKTPNAGKQGAAAGSGRTAAAASGASARSSTSKKATPRNQKNFYTILGLVAAVFGVFIVYQVTKPESTSQPKFDPSLPLPEASGYMLGSQAAPVPVLEFADFECPACANFYALTEPDVRKLVEAGTISYRFFDFPLPNHANTWPASNAAACANEQGKFWEMHDALFDGQDQWNGQATKRPKGVFEDYAKRIGLDVGKWEDCYDQQKFLPNIQANAKEGERRFVGQTPTFIIGNRLVPGSISYDKFKAYVDSALADAKAAPATPLPMGDTALKKGS